MVMDGYDTTRYIRNELSGPISQIPIIALTANVTIEDNELCRAAGMNAFLTKPLNFKLLSAELRKWVK